MGHAGLQPTAIAKAMADRGYPISRWTAAIYSTTHIPRPGPPTPQQLQEWEQQLLQYLETKRAEGLVPNRKQTAEDLEFSASRLRRLIKDIRRKGIPVFRANYHHRKPRQKRQQPEEILTPEQIRLRCLMVRKGLL
jgi:AraC-like DNA-binding protein